jgi:hypothetical protein
MVNQTKNNSIEYKFRREFSLLLEHTVRETVDKILSILPENELGLYTATAIDLVRILFWERIGEMRTWQETKIAFQLAHKPPLARLTQDADGQPVSRSIWLSTTLLLAVERYCRLTPPGRRVEAGDVVVSRKRRIARVASEVMNWAKLDVIPVVTRTLLFGVTTFQAGIFRVNPKTILSTCWNMEWINPGGLVVSSPPACFVTRELLAATDRPTANVPESFVHSLELVLNYPLVVGDPEMRPDVPYFSATPFATDRRTRIGHLSFIFLSRSQLQEANVITKAFENLPESGFDLALDLYLSFLRQSISRERAANIAIALENLYLAGAGGQELGYRFQLHVMRFARCLPTDERISPKTARSLYKARSTVVHGDWGPASEKKVLKAIELLNTTGARLVRSTTLSVRSNRNRRRLKEISAEVEAAVNTSVPE